MDVHFVENNHFFHKTSLQGERENEYQFQHISSPTPNISLNDTPFIVGTELFDREKIGQPSPPMLKDSELQARGETLQNNNNPIELCVYTRRKFHQTTRDNPAILEDQSSSSSIPQGPGISDSSSNPIQFTDLNVPIALQKGTRTCTKHPIANFLSYHKLSENHRAFTSKITNLFVPRNIQETRSHSNWRTTVLEEMNALKRNRTWEIVKLPEEKKAVGCKWMFTIKCKVDGSMERYKEPIVVSSMYPLTPILYTLKTNQAKYSSK